MKRQFNQQQSIQHMLNIAKNQPTIVKTTPSPQEPVIEEPESIVEEKTVELIATGSKFENKILKK